MQTAVATSGGYLTEKTQTWFTDKGTGQASDSSLGSGGGVGTGRATAVRLDSMGTPSANQMLGKTMAAERGWRGRQWSCLLTLWNRESGWRSSAANPTSSAYGIPQSLPGNKMAAAGSDWRTNPATQIRWGLDYIDDRYGTPCSAWAHWSSGKTVNGRDVGHWY